MLEIESDAEWPVAMSCLSRAETSMHYSARCCRIKGRTTFQLPRQIPAALSVIRWLAVAPGSHKSASIKGSSERSSGVMDYGGALVDGNVRCHSAVKQKLEMNVPAVIIQWTD